MIDLVILVVSVAVVDSLNPTTIAPALFLAAGPRPERSVIGFAAGFFVVNVAAGVVVLLVGHGLAAHVPRPAPGLLHLVEIAAGVAAVAGGVILWRRRHRVRAGVARVDRGSSRVVLLAGATIAGVELPTAVPYFAVVAALAASSQTLAFQLAMVIVFNLLFLTPVLTIAVVRALAGRRGAAVLGKIHALALRHMGSAVAVLVLFLGCVLLILGAGGLANAQ